MGLVPEALEAINRARAARGEPPLRNDDVPAFHTPPTPEDLAVIDPIADEAIRPPFPEAVRAPRRPTP